MALLLGLVALWGLLVVDLHFEHEKTHQEVRQRLEQQVRIVHDNLSKRLQTTSNALDAIQFDLSWMLAEPDMLNSRLRALAKSIIGMHAFLVLDREGSVVASNRPELIGMNFLDAEACRAIRQGNDPERLYLAGPLSTPSPGGVMSAGKMIADERKQFDGCLLAIVDTGYFSLLMRSVLFAPDMHSTMLHVDGRVILREPDLEGLTGKNLGEIPDSIFSRYRRLGQPSALIEAVSGVTGEPMITRLVAVRPEVTSSDHALVFALSRNRDAIFAPWRKEAIEHVSMLLIVSVVGCVVLLRYQRRQRAFERVRAEQRSERERAAERLRQHERFAAETVDAIGAQLCVLDRSGKIVLINSAWRNLHDQNTPPGHERAGYCVGDDYLGNCIPGLPDGAEAARAATDGIGRLLAGSAREFTLEYPCHTPQRQRWLQLTARAFDDGSGHVVVMHEDITVRKVAEETLNRAKAEVESANQAKESFLSNMSHELRTPLNAMIGFVSLAQASMLTPAQQQLLGQAQSASRQLLALIDDLLDFVRLDTATLGLERQHFELGAMLELVLGRLREKALAKGLKLSLDVGADVPRFLSGDVVQLGQVLHKLGDNAVKFTEAGEVLLAVRAVDHPNESVLLKFELIDTGIGLSEQQQACLFQDFHQADVSLARKHGGTGIGLAIARRLVELMGGQIGVESQLGVGSRFWFTVRLGVVQQQDPKQLPSPLPVVAGAGVAPTPVPLPEPATGGASWLELRAQLCDLLADDNAASLQFCETHADCLRSALGGRYDATMRAVRGFDFEQALALVRDRP